MKTRTKGDRGLRDYGASDVKDAYGQTVTVRTSSVHGHAWIFCKDKDGNDHVHHPPTPGGISVRSPHLNPRQAVSLVNRLLAFIAEYKPAALKQLRVPGYELISHDSGEYEEEQT